MMNTYKGMRTRQNFTSVLIFFISSALYFNCLYSYIYVSCSKEKALTAYPLATKF